MLNYLVISKKSCNFAVRFEPLAIEIEEYRVQNTEYRQYFIE